LSRFKVLFFVAKKGFQAPIASVMADDAPNIFITRFIL